MASPDPVKRTLYAVLTFILGIAAVMVFIGFLAVKSGLMNMAGPGDEPTAGLEDQSGRINELEGLLGQREKETPVEDDGFSTLPGPEAATT